MKKTLLPSAFFLALVSAVNGFADEADKPAIEQVGAEKQQNLSFRKDDDIATMLSKRKRELTAKTKGKYSIASAQTEVPQDLNSEVSVEEFYASFKEAYSLAVTNLIMQETRAKITSDLSSRTGTNLGDDKSNADKCASDYMREQKRLEKEKKERENSFLGTAERMFDKFMASDEGSEKLAEENSEQDEEVNNYIVCEAKQNIKQLKSNLGKNISGVMAGVRVMDTLVDIENGKIGVVVGRSAETSKDAGVLKAQNLVEKPLDSALEEALTFGSQIVESYQKSTQEPPFGIMGVRGKRLSNGEIAYFGFGTALQKEVHDELDSIANSLAIETAQTKALAALNEFAYMSASSNFQLEFEKQISKVLEETLDMDNRGEKVDIRKELDKELRATMNRTLKASSSGFLRSPQEIDTAAWSGGDSYPDFYLSVFVWSPSIMTNTSLAHDTMERSYKDAQKPSGESASSNNSRNVSPGVKSYKVEEDW